MCSRVRATGAAAAVPVSAARSSTRLHAPVSRSAPGAPPPPVGGRPRRAVQYAEQALRRASRSQRRDRVLECTPRSTSSHRLTRRSCRRRRTGEDRPIAADLPATFPESADRLDRAAGTSRRSGSLDTVVSRPAWRRTPAGSTRPDRGRRRSAGAATSIRRVRRGTHSGDDASTHRQQRVVSGTDRRRGPPRANGRRARRAFPSRAGPVAGLGRRGGGGFCAGGPLAAGVDSAGVAAGAGPEPGRLRGTHPVLLDTPGRSGAPGVVPGPLRPGRGAPVHRPAERARPAGGRRRRPGGQRRRRGPGGCGSAGPGVGAGVTG